MRTASRVLLPLAVSLALVSSVTSPVSAQVHERRDREKDVVLTEYVDCDEPSDRCLQASGSAPGHRLGDVRAVEVNYRRDRLILKVAVRDVRPTENKTTHVNWQLFSKRGHEAFASLRYDHLGLETLVVGLGGDEDCAKSTGRVFAKRNLYRLTIPVACIDDAPWVRVSTATRVVDGTGRKQWEDDAYSTPSDAGTPSPSDPRIGPRVRRLT